MDVRTLLARLLHHKFLLIALTAVFLGCVLMTTKWEFVRDVGSALFTAGTIGLIVEVYTRREFRSLVVAELTDVIEKSPLTARVNAMEPLVAQVDALTARVEMLEPLVSQIDALAPRVEALHGLVPLSNAIAQQGVKRIHPKRIDFKAVIEECRAGHEIRLLGVCMADFATQPMRNLMRRKLKEGCTIRLLTLLPDSEFAGHHASGGSLDETRATQRQIRSTDELHYDFIEGLAPELAAQIQFGHYDSPPHVLLVGTSETVIVSFYLRGGPGDLFPHVEMRYKPDGICSPFIDHFDSLWEARVEAREEGEEAQAAD